MSTIYGLDNDNFWKHDVNFACMLISLSKSSRLGMYGGLNIFQGKKYDVLGSNYRSPSTLGYNVGIMYDFKVFKRSFNSFVKYTNGFNDLTRNSLFKESGYKAVTVGISLNFQIKK